MRESFSQGASPTSISLSLVVGPDTPSNHINLIRSYWPKKGTSILGNGIKGISRRREDKIYKDKNPHNIVNYWGHGYTQKGKHRIGIYGDSYTPTSEVIKSLKGKPGIKNFWSCHVGATVNSLDNTSLDEGEFVVLHGGRVRTTVMAINMEEIAGLSDLCDLTQKIFKRPPNAFDIFEYSLAKSPESKSIAGVVNGKLVSHKTRAAKHILTNEEEIKRDRIVELEKFRKFRTGILGHNEKDFLPPEQLITKDSIARYRELDIIIKTYRSYDKEREHRYLKDYLDNGGNSNAETLSRFNLLSIAADEGNVANVDILLNKGVDVNYTNENGWSALHCACNQGHDLVVQRLLDIEEINVDLRVDNGYTALHLACQQGSFYSVALLSKKTKLSLDDKTDNGFTALHIACNMSHYDVANLLLRKGANPHIKDTYGYTALHYIASNGNVDTTKFIMKMDTTPKNVPDKRGVTPFHLACQNGHAGVAKVLFEQEKIDLEQKTNAGNTALHLACSHKKLPVVRSLLEWGADIEAPDFFGSTPLHLSSMNGHLQMIDLLLSNGANIQAKNGGTFTPLMMAAMHGQGKVVDMFLDRINDPNYFKMASNQKEAKEFSEKHHVSMPDFLDMSAAEIARANGHHAIAKKIENRIKALEQPLQIKPKISEQRTIKREKKPNIIKKIIEEKAPKKEGIGEEEKINQLRTLKNLGKFTKNLSKSSFTDDKER